VKPRLAILPMAFLLFLTGGSALAVEPNEMLADPALEARAQAIGKELRCPVCQGQSIEDSDAALAHDLRVLVRSRLKAGDSDDQVKQYLVARYGDYVLLKPPLKKETVILWFGPLILLLGAAGAVTVFYRRRTRPEAVPANEDER
jgi:cytochrome c-type biogenesis protein CcmH